MTRKLIYILIFLITSINHSFADDDFLTENIITAKKNTDYALILEFLDFKNEKIGEADEYFTNKTTYRTRILEVIKGDLSKDVEFTFYYVSDDGDIETTLHKNPQLLFLCKDDNGEFYFAGPGTWFSAEQNIIDIAKDVKNDDPISDRQSSFCNE
jgi:hypothetical protein